MGLVSEMPFVGPKDVEELVATHLASGRYCSGDEVLRSAMQALAAVDEDLEAVQQAVSEWQAGDEGTPLADAFKQIRVAASHGVGEWHIGSFCSRSP